MAPVSGFADSDRTFNRVATFPVYLNTDVNNETVAEIVDASKDGKTLVYTDSELEMTGFVDIKKPSSPKPLGTVSVGGEPTSVAVAGDYALVAVNTSPDFVYPSGVLHLIDIKSQTIVATHNLAGQPDSVAVSPDGRYAAIVIENERNEEWCVVPGAGLTNDFPVPEDDKEAEAACDTAGGEVGGLPQLPSGLLQIVDLVGGPTDWTLRDVSLDGIADLAPEDAEAEYVDINSENVAVVTLQENNHIALVDLATGSVINDFTAGTVNLTQIDTKEEDPALIRLTDTQTDRAREPDGVTWISTGLLATADEGDLYGGSRGITVFDTAGNVVFSSGNALEHEVVRDGHYPDGRSKNKGNETENVEYGEFNGERFLFAVSERSSVIFVYKVKGVDSEPELVQTLPAGVGPEGIKAIPKRGLLISASENDDRGDKFRGTLTIYQAGKGDADYPTIVSADRTDGTPIPWAALSGFAVDPNDDDTIYTIHDSFYQQSRIYTMDVNSHPAVITGETVLMDSAQTVNLDPEGIAVSASGDGSFWVASEGMGSVDDPNRPVTSKSVVVHADANGNIIETITLPPSVNALQRRFGFEGVASVMEGDVEILYVAFQRAWVGDPAPNNIDNGGKVRIGRYDTKSGDWTFAYYPLDVRESPNGGWVGLSEITALGEGEFAIVERDNQANTDARIKRVYRIDVDDVTFKPQDMEFETLGKTLVRDLMPDLEATNGMVLEKIESLAVTSDGDMQFANDNDGVDDSSGETQLIRIKKVFK
ncbi:MAG: esterase-like activity of phytase family protein [Pseudomonadota bacterium]|nr:esterase-like activity of phytase family protein [Pseudomonadota bacterium]